MRQLNWQGLIYVVLRKYYNYLNYLFFDEQQQLVPSLSQIWQADGDNNWRSIGTDSNAIEVPKNGYVLVYLSNESNQTTYFDNLTIDVTMGVLLEEKH